MRNTDYFYNNLSEQLKGLADAGTYKYLRYITGKMAGETNLEKEGDVVILCSNNYIGLCYKPEIVAAGKEALDQYGAGASSVRFICGTFDIHRQLEELTARFLGMEASLSYTSCWAANTAAIPALLSPGDTVISDELNHASIIDGCKATAKGVNRAVYKHADMADLEEKLQAAKDSPVILVVTDGVFSMEGYIAPLPEIIALCKKYGALVMVDDSHATGVIGKTGRGTMEYYGITEGVDIISGTYGKALGGAGGGFIASTKDVCEMLVQKSRPHLFSNSLPPVLCAIAHAAITYLDSHPEIVTSLMAKVKYMREKILAAGLTPLEGDSAIIPLIVGETATAIRASQMMIDKGVFAIGFGFPVVPEGVARIRLQVSDSLSYENIDYAVDVIKEALAAI
jgi:glycine C-acetyltransferase